MAAAKYEETIRSRGRRVRRNLHVKYIVDAYCNIRISRLPMRMMVKALNVLKSLFSTAWPGFHWGPMTAKPTMTPNWIALQTRSKTLSLENRTS
jgi:hypothetical protein